eukprot:scaffold103276_cov69-Phaeocystis_antarctica.AAC.2
MTYRSAAQKTRGRTLAYAGAGADSGQSSKTVQYGRADVHEITTVTTVRGWRNGLQYAPTQAAGPIAPLLECCLGPIAHRSKTNRDANPGAAVLLMARRAPRLRRTASATPACAMPASAMPATPPPRLVAHVFARDKL